MIKLLLNILFSCSTFFLTAQSQTVIHINAGSRASWGTYQNLLIDNNGQCSFQLREVNGTVKDSSYFTITRSQLESLFAKADQLGFFQLKNKYDGGYVDGAGILISMNSGGKKHGVQLLNTDIPQINELVAFVNSILEPQKIRIYYGQSSPKK